MIKLITILSFCLLNTAFSRAPAVDPGVEVELTSSTVDESLSNNGKEVLFTYDFSNPVTQVANKNETYFSTFSLAFVFSFITLASLLWMVLRKNTRSETPTFSEILESSLNKFEENSSKKSEGQGEVLSLPVQKNDQNEINKKAS